MPLPTKYIYTWNTTICVPSSELGPPPPFPLSQGVYPPSWTKGGGGRDTRLQVRGWGSPNLDDWRKKPSTLSTLWSLTNKKANSKNFQLWISSSGHCNEVTILYTYKKRFSSYYRKFGRKRQNDKYYEQSHNESIKQLLIKYSYLQIFYVIVYSLKTEKDM